MNYYVYTDGARSIERGVGSWAYLIFTDTSFIEWNFNKTKYIESPTYAEDVAIGTACNSLIGMGLTKEDTVIIHTDSLATIKHMNYLMEKDWDYIHESILIEDAIKNLKELYKVTNVEFCKVHAHKNALNPNICVDRMAKYALRS